MLYIYQARAFTERQGVPFRYVHHDGGGDK